MTLIKIISDFIYGPAKYRRKGLWVELKGSICKYGPWWERTHFTEFKSKEEAEMFAKKWAKENNGIYLEVSEK
jgi:hypothetical protein